MGTFRCELETLKTKMDILKIKMVIQVKQEDVMINLRFENFTVIFVQSLHFICPNN